MWHHIRIALILLGIFTVLTGIIYPLVVTGISQAVFSHQANGSLIVEDGIVVGSELIGQSFGDPKYFWGRLSATTVFPYNASASSGSNYGPLNSKLRQAIESRVDALKTFNPENNQPIPIDLVTFSASGLDPHISIAAANYQIPRVAQYRGITEEQVFELVNRFTEGRQLGILGEPRVNVLKLNLALDEIK
jgi:potassium-transporting ATPase KdpC subunit